MTDRPTPRFLPSRLNSSKCVPMSTLWDGEAPAEPLTLRKKVAQRELRPPQIKTSDEFRDTLSDDTRSTMVQPCRLSLHVLLRNPWPLQHRIKVLGELDDGIPVGRDNVLSMGKVVSEPFELLRSLLKLPPRIVLGK